MSPRSRVQQFAGHYTRNLGFSVLPLIGKACFDPDWPSRTYDVRHFAVESNIGIRSVDGLVILDDDFKTPAVACADALLARTGAVYGRPRKPRSKRLYRSEGLKSTLTLKDLDGHDAVQIRVGLQDMAPPSRHPDTGETLKWDGLLLEPSRVDADFLVAASRHYWAARLIGRHWPERGRHELRLALARVLLKVLEVPDPFAAAVLEWACRLGGSDEKGVADARAAIRDTRRRLEAGHRAAGAPTVAQLLPADDIGGRLIRALRAGFGKTNQLDERVEELNRRYFIIDVGAETVVGEEVERDGWKDLQFRPFEAFKRKLIKETIKAGDRYQPLADAWLRHKDGARFDTLVYAPPGSGIRVGSEDYNGWRGFTVTPSPGDWSLTRDVLIRQLMCGGDVALVEFVLDWMAALFQQPGRHAETALVLIGPQGVGKNVFGSDVVARTFDGRHARVTTHVRQVLGEFNEILSGLCLLVLDEVGLTNAADYNGLKGLITGHAVDINRKGLRMVTERSMLHVVFLSNYDVPLKVASDDRRFAFFRFADTHQNDAPFFRALVNQLETGGRAAMLHELLARPVDWDRLRRAPDSAPKREAKREGWTHGQWFLFRKMRELRLEWTTHRDAHGNEIRRVRRSEWATEYEVYVRQVSRRDGPKDSQSELQRELRRLMPEGWDMTRPVSEGGVVGRDFWTLPGWAELRSSFEAVVGDSLDDLMEGGEDVAPF